MRNYLFTFFKEFEYEEEDVKQLLCAYDKITAAAEANAVFQSALTAYEENILLDYQEQILKPSQKVASLANLHPFTVDLLLFICMTKRLKAAYLERGLDLQIYRDSVLDLRWKLEECKAVKGICGSFVATWFPCFFNMTRFALGRLQFELIPLPFNYEREGVKLEKGATVINVHIPRTGTPMDKDSCDKSYAQAREFFKAEVGDNPAFICHSWLLYPENKRILQPHTNVYRFLSEYDIVEWHDNNGEDLWRLFDTDEKDPTKLPTNGSLREGYVEHLKRGGKVGVGVGIKLSNP